MEEKGETEQKGKAIRPALPTCHRRPGPCLSLTSPRPPIPPGPRQPLTSAQALLDAAGICDQTSEGIRPRGPQEHRLRSQVLSSISILFWIEAFIPFICDVTT